MRDLFLAKLSETYGEWDKNSARFGNLSYGDIASDLCISGSQFTKLLYGTATNGMYERSIRNVEQLQELKKLKKDNRLLEDEIGGFREKLSEASKRNTFRYKYLFFVALLLITFLFYLMRLSAKETTPIQSNLEDSDKHALASFFDRNFKSDHISPFLDISDAQEYCPASAYEGVWALEKPYIIPLPINKPGLYYLAKASDIRVKCYRSVEEEEKGKILLGFENMTHELWIDSNREPLAPRYFNTESKSYTKAFFNIDFESNPAFKKVATVKSFMFNTFAIEKDHIIRNAEPSGRYAEEIDHDLVDEFEIDIKDVLQNILGNMVQTQCNPGVNNNCNPNTLVENESTMKFDCQFTIDNENLGFGGSYPYSKTFKLRKQNYSDNLLCSCDE